MDPRNGKELTYMPKIYTCYLTAVNVVVNSTSNTFRTDMSPYEIDVSIQFQETKILDRDEINALEGGSRINRDDEAYDQLSNDVSSIAGSLLNRLTGAASDAVTDAEAKNGETRRQVTKNNIMFFNQFPKTVYSIQNDAIQNTITDYFRYVGVIDRLAQSTFAYSTIDILDSERPDTLSYRLYGTPDYYWTFFISNDFLKEGLSAWPKGDSEIKNHIANQYKNISAFRFPVGEADDGGRRSTILGIPIKNKSYLPYLRLCKRIGYENAGAVEVFASAKIADYDSNMSLIWIDNSDITWHASDRFTDPEGNDTINEQVGDAAALDIKYSAESKVDMFYSGQQAEDFSVQFVSDGTAAADALRPKFYR